jgi:hypothetical protein
MGGSTSKRAKVAKKNKNKKKSDANLSNLEVFYNLHKNDKPLVDNKKFIPLNLHKSFNHIFNQTNTNNNTDTQLGHLYTIKEQ